MTMLLFSAHAWAAAVITLPNMPLLSMSRSTPGSTAAVSASVYDTVYVDALTNQLFCYRGLKEWGVVAKSHGGTNPTWRMHVEVSNDGQTWTPIAHHHSKGGEANGQVVWAAHKKAVSARLTLEDVTGGALITATAYGAP